MPSPRPTDHRRASAVLLRRLGLALLVAGLLSGGCSDGSSGKIFDGAAGGGAGSSTWDVMYWDQGHWQ